MASTAMELMGQIRSAEQHRPQAQRAAGARLAKAEAKCEAVAANMAERRRSHEQQLADLAAATERQVAKIAQAADKASDRFEEATRTARESRELLEAEARATLAEAGAIEMTMAEDRAQNEHRIGAADMATQEVLKTAAVHADEERWNSDRTVKSVLGRLRNESDRVWALENLRSRAEELSGAKTLRTDWDIHAAPRLEVLPFGPHYRPFEGFGTYGADLTRRFPPAGFKAETAHNLRLSKQRTEWEAAPVHTRAGKAAVGWEPTGAINRGARG